MAKLPWKSWHEVVQLREDLRSGELPMHMFAADLYEVMMQSGRRPSYEDPKQFFGITFPTYNLRRLVRDVMLRVAGKNDKAVRQLTLTYGGGKTHTLITLRHLAFDPQSLPDLPAVAEFREATGQVLPKACIVALCFDKIDVETGQDVRGPDGSVRRLKHPWSILAYQIAGEDGLRLLHAEKLAEERETAPAENLLTELLEIPVKAGLGVLILLDEVLVYVREKTGMDRKWRDRLINFFQYLTQAATKVDRCCIVASLLASDPKRRDVLGRPLEGDLFDIFQRQKEAPVEPVVKEDVAELLRRRFFTPKSLKDRESFRPRVQAALKGICTLDEPTAKEGSAAEEKYLKSYPFHPDLTEVFYTKWTQMEHFQKARGVLRTFALALRDAENWDTSPLVGPGAFLNAPKLEGLSDALRELVGVADTEQHEGRKPAWTGIIEGELDRARQIQNNFVSLRSREVEQAVATVFLHSQPIGMSARTRDLMVLLGAARPDRIELEKGLIQWAQVSLWLDDRYTAVDEGQLPGTWRLGNRPNLNQMHAVAMGRIDESIVRARLIDEIAKTKSLAAGASGAGAKVHTLPARPRDVEDDGFFHFAILGLNGVSDSGKPGAEARRFVDETTGSDKPRVYRNAILLLAPSSDGLETAVARVHDYLAWEQVSADLKEQEKEGEVDPVRMQTLRINIDKSKGRIPESIKQAYCTVVTVSAKNEVDAFKINVAGDSHFSIIKNDSRSRIRESAITAEALLPDGPYDLWREGETSRRVRDLSGAFSQLPHLPKMLKAQAILDTLADGCEQGSFVLKLTRPDGSYRTWWRSRPDEAAMKDPALELVLPEAAELNQIPQEVTSKGKLPELWKSEALTVQALYDYFRGGNVIQVQRDGYMEPAPIPKANQGVIDAAIKSAVESGDLWLLNIPASILAEPIPIGVLTGKAELRETPEPISAVEIMPENLPDAWADNQATALSIMTALSQKRELPLPWKTAEDVIANAIRARFIRLDELSGEWPCDFPRAGSVKLRVMSKIDGGLGPDGPRGPRRETKVRVAETELEISEIQDLADLAPELSKVKAKTAVPLKFRLQVEFGDGKEPPPDDAVEEINKILAEMKEDFQLR